MGLSLEKVEPIQRVRQKGLNPVPDTNNSFHSILRSYVQNAKPSNKLRQEFQGVLRNCRFAIGGKGVCRFKLETEKNDVLLSISKSLMPLAQKHLWDEVKVRGHFDNLGFIFEVDTIVPISCEEDPCLNTLDDDDWEMERYRAKINRDGAIEPRLELISF